MKKISHYISKFAGTMNNLKHNKKTLIMLICVDTFLAVCSNIVDWPVLITIKWYLLPLAPICSLYPLTLAIWFILYYYRKKIPAWYTTFIFVGIVSYGFMAYIYYPMYMAWDGINLRMIGNMIWVTFYALQSFIIASELKKATILQYIIIATYFAGKDYSDRFLGSFPGIIKGDFPEQLKNIFLISMVLLHIVAFTLAFTRASQRI
jgi:hypothetical protein